MNSNQKAFDDESLAKRIRRAGGLRRQGAQPVTWETVPIEKLATDLQPGFACQPSTDSGSVPQLRTNNVSSDGSIDLSEVKCVPTTGSQIERYRLERGDILFNNTNSPALVGKTAYFDEEGLYLFSNHMTRVRVDARVADPRFVARFLHWSWSQGALRGLVTQWVNQAAINRALLASVLVPVPPLSEQRRIVEILDQADRLRRLRAEADAKADRILPALFIKMFGDPASLTRHPQAKPLSSFDLHMQNGFACGEKDVEEGVPHLRMNNIGDSGELDLDLVRTVPRARDTERYRLRSQDILFMSTNSEEKIGKACVFFGNTSEHCLFSNHLIRIRISDRRLVPEYVASYLHLLWQARYFTAIAKRWVNQSTVTAESLKRLPIVAFPADRQSAFAAARQSLRAGRDRSANSATRLDRIGGTLLSRAFSGDLTAEWREAHMKELFQEMELQAKTLAEAP